MASRSISQGWVVAVAVLLGAGLWGGAPAEAVHAPLPTGPALPSASHASALPATARAPGSLPVPASPSEAPVRNGPTAALAETIERAGVPLRYAFLPNLDARSSNPPSVGHIVPTYSTVPAPLGLADLGLVNVSGELAPTNLSTTGVAGTFAPTAFSGISVDSGAPDAYGIQLNAVLTNVSLFGNDSYQFWTQNVVEYSTFSHQLAFLDNVWNFSGGNGALSTNAIASHGANGTQVGTTYYYALGPVVTMGYPFTLSLFLNAVSAPGENVVYFNYTLANATRTLSGSFDRVGFNSTGTGGPAPPVAVFLADGYAYNPLGLPDDFELDLVGPGGGSNFAALNASAALNLYTWSAASQAFVVVPSAFDAGAETGETSSGLSSTWTPNGDLGLRGVPGPAAHLGQGPGLLEGEWNVSPASAGIDRVQYRLSPENGFTFVGPGISPPLSAFGWAPDSTSFDLPPGTYTVWALASEYAPQRTTLTVTAGGVDLNVTLTASPAAGVYTPLWALDAAGLGNISSSCAAGSCVLDNNQVGPLGVTSATGRGMYFPWFGEFNDFFFPAFPGLFLWDLGNVVVASPPSFEVDTPSWLTNDSEHFGTPGTNDLGLFFYDDSNVTLANGAAIGGWWFEPAYFGPNAPQYSVVFWNTSESSVVGNTFTTGGGALYFYGGENNTVWNNTFLAYVPLAPNAGSISGAVRGTNGLFDADFGEARAAGSGCRCGDLVYNNVFGDYHPAYAPTVDPYTGLAPRLPFDQLWNVTPAPGSNILGGSRIGGNYWWNYGSSDDPYWVLPYKASGTIAVGGDAAPLVPTPLRTVTFEVTGLPAGTPWRVGVFTSSGTAFNGSNGTSLTELWPEGEYFYTASALSNAYGIPTTQIFQVALANVTEQLTFYPLYTLAFLTTNFPAGSFWAITLSSPMWGGFIDLGNVADFPAETLAVGSYNYTVSPPAGYTAFPPEGSVNLTANTTVPLSFSKVGAPGYLVLTLPPTVGAQVWVDDQPVSNASVGTVNLSLPAGVHSIRATAPGNYPYYDNVSIEGGGSTYVQIAFVPLAHSGSTSAAPAVVIPWVVAGAAVAVAVALAATLGYLLTRRPAPRGPPPPPTGPGPST